MYKIKLDIKEPRVTLWGPEGYDEDTKETFIVPVHRIHSYVEFNYIRAQIKQNNLNGYYVMFNDQKVEINPDGKLYEWPDGLYDQNDKLLDILID